MQIALNNQLSWMLSCGMVDVENLVDLSKAEVVSKNKDFNDDNKASEENDIEDQVRLPTMKEEILRLHECGRDPKTIAGMLGRDVCRVRGVLIKEKRIVKSTKGRKGRVVVQMTMAGEKVGEYASSMEADRESGVSRSSILHCIKGDTTHAGGYKWHFKDEEIAGVPLSGLDRMQMRIVSLKRSGKHIDRIISLTGVPRSQVRAILRNNGLLKGFGDTGNG